MTIEHEVIEYHNVSSSPSPKPKILKIPSNYSTISSIATKFLFKLRIRISLASNFALKTSKICRENIPSFFKQRTAPSDGILVCNSNSHWRCSSRITHLFQDRRATPRNHPCREAKKSQTKLKPLVMIPKLKTPHPSCEFDVITAYFEVYRIDVKSFDPEARPLERIKMDKDIIYHHEHSVLENQQLLLCGPKLPPEGLDPVTFYFGPHSSWWFYKFIRKTYPDNKILSVEVKDRNSQECFVIHYERVLKAITANIQVVYDGDHNDSDLRIVHGQISAVSRDDERTKRLLLHVDGEKIEHEEKKPRVSPLEPGKAIDLLRSVLVSHLDSNLAIEVELILSAEARGGGSKTFLPVNEKVTFKSPPKQYEVFDRKQMEDITWENQTIIGAGGSKIRVAVAWFNDQIPTHTCNFPDPVTDSEDSDMD